MLVSGSEDFGKIIRARRKQLGYTQSFLADVSGFSITFISDLERGKCTAELNKSIFLANLLGIDCLLNVRGDE